MANRPEPNKWARLDFPPEFGVGIKQFAVDCGWRLKVVGGATYVATNERYNNVRPQLLRLVKVADAREAGKPELYKRFDSWPRQDAFGSPEISKLVADLREVRDPQDNIDALVSFRLQFTTVPDAHVGDYLSHLFPLIAGTTPDASLWSIEVDPSFRWRVAAVRALFSAREAPEVLERKKTNKALRFSSSQGLAEAWNLGLGVFTEPMLLAGSPWLAGVSSYRIGGSAVILFGRPMAGFSARQAVEGLDLFRTSGLANARVGTTAPENSPLAYETALTWWVNKLNDLAGMALDVGKFSDKNGIYQPAAHLGVLKRGRSQPDTPHLRGRRPQRAGANAADAACDRPG